MKRFKKYMALAVALIMALALAAPVFADETNTDSGDSTTTAAAATETGSITINNTQLKVGDDTNTYTIYKIFDANPKGDGDDRSEPTATYVGTVGYTATNVQKEYWERETVKVGEEDKAPFVFTMSGNKSAEESEYTVTLTEGVTAKAISDYFNALKARTTGDTIDQLVSKEVFKRVDAKSPTGDGAALEFTGVPFGYYFITSSIGAVVSVDTTNKDVQINDKNIYGDEFTGENDDGSLKAVVKTTSKDEKNEDVVTEISAGTNTDVKVNDTVEYTLATTAANYVVKKTETEGATPETEGATPETQKVLYVYLYDELGAGLDYVLDNTNNVPALTVTVGENLTYYVEDAEGGFVMETPNGAMVAYDAENEAHAGLQRYAVSPTKTNISRAANTTTLTLNATAFNYQSGDTRQYYITEYNSTTAARKFKVMIPWTDDNGNPVFADGAKVSVTYSAKVNNDASVYDKTKDDETTSWADNTANNNVTNTAKVGYYPGDVTDKDKDGTTLTETVVTTDNTTVYTYALAIKKIDGTTGEPLEGVEFKLQDKAGNWIIATTNSDNEYVYASIIPNLNDAGTSNEASATGLKTDSNGVIILRGVNDDTYTLTESATVQGYNLMTGTKDFEAIKTGEVTTSTTVTSNKTYTFKEAADGTYVKVGEGDSATFRLATAEDTDETRYSRTTSGDTDTTVVTAKEVTDLGIPAAQVVEIENNTGTELPSTGGIGTTIFYVTGGLLMAAAVIFFVTKKRASV